MERDFVAVKIDIDRMTNGKRVGLGLRAGHDGGIPWFLFADPSEPLLREKPSDDGSAAGKDAPLQRRKSAILATADGPEGNVGCPMSKSERTHFMSMMRAARLTLTDKELAVIANALHDYAREVVGERADQ